MRSISRTRQDTAWSNSPYTKYSDHDSNVKRPLWEPRKVFGARIKIMWEGQLVDPQIHYIMEWVLPF